MRQYIGCFAFVKKDRPVPNGDSQAAILVRDLDSLFGSEPFMDDSDTVFNFFHHYDAFFVVLLFSRATSNSTRRT